MMAKRSCLILVQSRHESEYNDFTGKYYHFPKKYLNIISTGGPEFVYYESKTRGEGVYFGYGRLGRLFPDKKEKDHFFVEVLDYKPFSKEVPFITQDGHPRESGPTYNAQNAVRRISSEILDAICLDGGILLTFKADAHLIRVLGEQLIASEKVGILELIKNSYDANANYCTVLIENVPTLPSIDRSLYRFPDLEGPVIVVEDDGIGMTKEVIEKGWLRPASTLKTEIKERLKREKLKAIESDTLGTYASLVSQLKKEYGNRIPLGEKGVGRFATHRLGRKLIVRTKVKGAEYEYVLKIDWDSFDKISDEPIDLDSIGVSLERSKPSRDYGVTDSGTQIIIYGGKEGFSWDQDAIEDLNRSILSLNSPQHGRASALKNRNFLRSENEHLPEKKNFEANLECQQLPNLQRTLPVDLFDPVLSFDGLVDENGILDYELTFKPPASVPMVAEPPFRDKSFDLKKCDLDYWKNIGGYRVPECGAFFFHVDVWYRDRPWIDGPEADTFIKFLTNFGGVSVYRDDIIVFPAEWGAETDWLGLKTRHIKQGWRMSYYNLIGNVEIEQTRNLNLVDKTDRQGLIKNRAYLDLARLVRSILLNIIETQFVGKRDQYNKLTKGITRDPKTLAGYTRDASNIVNGVLHNYPIEEDPHSLLQGFGTGQERQERLVNLERSIKNLQKSLVLIEEEKELLTELAGYGLAIGVSVHEITKITANFYYAITELLKKRTLDENKLKELKDSSSSLQSELKRLSPIRAIRNERKSEFPVLKPIGYAAEVFGRRFKKLNIQFRIEHEDHNFNLYSRYGALIQVFSNLFENSCYWLDSDTESDRRIVVQVENDKRRVIVADSGPGIHDSILPYLFQAGYSLKMPQSGLGLYVCKYYMQSMKGDIFLTAERERIPSCKGAQFTLDFWKLPENKEAAKE